MTTFDKDSALRVAALDAAIKSGEDPEQTVRRAEVYRAFLSAGEFVFTNHHFRAKLVADGDQALDAMERSRQAAKRPFVAHDDDGRRERAHGQRLRSRAKAQAKAKARRGSENS